MSTRIATAIHPTRAAIAALPVSTNVKIATAELGGLGLRVIDLGCGEGKFTRGLCALFPEVTGLDVKEGKIAYANDKAREEGVNAKFVAGSAQAIPFGEGHFDAVIFSNSLHHMPDPAAALKEALRTLRAGGLLYVMEPVPSGNYHDATCLVNDETQVRTQAYEAMLAMTGAREEKEILYRAPRRFAGFDDWRDEQIDRDPKRQAFFDKDPEKVRATFEGHAEREDGKLVFDQVFRVNILRKD
jgi:ubiquinone/menaquinone biosynthesis C-methylase UbiE